MVLKGVVPVGRTGCRGGAGERTGAGAYAGVPLLGHERQHGTALAAGFQGRWARPPVVPRCAKSLTRGMFQLGSTAKGNFPYLSLGLAGG